MLPPLEKVRIAPGAVALLEEAVGPHISFLDSNHMSGTSASDQLWA
jgi:hypothetical protein